MAGLIPNHGGHRDPGSGQRVRRAANLRRDLSSFSGCASLVFWFVSRVRGVDSDG
jgi:hypothetical protein